MSTEKRCCVVAVELTAEYVQQNRVFVDWLGKKNPAIHSRENDSLTFRFRAPQPINAVVTLAPGCVLRDELEPSSDASLQPLTKALLARLRATNSRHDEPEDTGQDDNECYQPSPDECEAYNHEQHYQDEPTRDSVNRAEPEIKAQWSGTERQHEAQPATNAAQEKPRIELPFQWDEADAIFAPVEPCKWLCQALQIGPGRCCFFCSAPGIGKTILLQTFAVCVATGRNVFDDLSFKINRSGPVVHIDYDQGKEASYERYQAICNAYGIAFDDMRGKLFYKSRPPLHASDSRTIELWKTLCNGVALCTIDAVHGLIPDKDIMHPEFAHGIYMLNEVSNSTGTTFLVNAHSPKAPRDPRARKAPEHSMMGSMQNFAAAGAVFDISKDEHGNRIVSMVKAHERNRGKWVDPFVACFKQIDIPGSEIGGLLVTAETHEQAKEKTAPAKPTKKLDALMRKMLEHVKVNGGIGTRELYASLEGGTENKKAAHESLVRLGYLQIQKSTKRNEADKSFATGPGLAWLGGKVVHVVTSTPNTPPSAPQDATTTPETSANPNDPPKDP